MENQIHRLLQDSLFLSVKEHPDKVAVVADGTAHTYRQLLDESLKVAFILSTHGIRRGDRIAIMLENNWYCVSAIFGTLLAGGVFSVLNPSVKAEKLAYTLNDCTAKSLITTNQYSSVVLPAMRKSPSVTILLSHDESNSATAPFFSTFSNIFDDSNYPSSIDSSTIPLDLAGLIYTSGSTGEPKGVMMTHQAMVFTTASIIQYLRLKPEDCIINTLPLSFDYGLYQLLMTIRLGATLVLERSFAYPARTLELIQNHGVTVFPGVPTMYMTLIGMHRRKKIDLPTITCITNTAAALPTDIVPQLQEIFPKANIFRMYGLTECKRVSYLEPELIDEKPDSVGKAIPGTETFILDENGNSVPPGQAGILHVRGPHIMAGYWNKPDLSAEMLKPGLLPGEHMLCTHDYFMVDEDGFLYFKGRSDDIIKSGGQKVSPAEIENVLYGIPGIREAAVVGDPDPLLGEAIKAFIVLEKECRFSGQEIRALCFQKLESFLVPREIVLLDDLPKTSSGKIRKRELNAQYRISKNLKPDNTEE